MSFLRSKRAKKILEDLIILVIALGITVSIMIALWPPIIRVLGQIF